MAARVISITSARKLALSGLLLLGAQSAMAVSRIDDDVATRQRQDAMNGSGAVGAVLNNWIDSGRDARERTERKEYVTKNSAHVSCALESGGASLPCMSVTFVVRDSAGREIRRIRTDNRGELIVVIPPSESYQLSPLSERYRIEPLFARALKPGDQADIRLKAVP